MSTGKVVLGVLAGLAIGSIAGILFAPEKGSKTRKQITDKGDDYVTALKSKINEFYNSLEEHFESTRNEAEILADKGRAKYEVAKKEAKKAASDIKHAV